MPFAFNVGGIKLEVSIDYNTKKLYLYDINKGLGYEYDPLLRHDDLSLDLAAQIAEEYLHREFENFILVPGSIEVSLKINTNHTKEREAK